MSNTIHHHSFQKFETLKVVDLRVKFMYYGLAHVDGESVLVIHQVSFVKAKPLRVVLVRLH